MKIRTGFVSNSSSSSFCIAKTFMKESQIKLFKSFLSKMNDNDDFCGEYGTYIDEGKHYFIGTIDNCAYEGINNFFKQFNLEEYVAYGEG